MKFRNMRFYLNDGEVTVNLRDLIAAAGDGAHSTMAEHYAKDTPEEYQINLWRENGVLEMLVLFKTLNAEVEEMIGE